MEELQKKFSELKSIILRSKKFNTRKDFHLSLLLEEISSKINQENKESKEIATKILSILRDRTEIDTCGLDDWQLIDIIARTIRQAKQ